MMEHTVWISASGKLEIKQTKFHVNGCVQE
jgi:hypothetical protein